MGIVAIAAGIGASFAFGLDFWQGFCLTAIAYACASND